MVSEQMRPESNSASLHFPDFSPSQHLFVRIETVEFVGRLSDAIADGLDEKIDAGGKTQSPQDRKGASKYARVTVIKCNRADEAGRRRNPFALYDGIELEYRGVVAE